MEALEDLIPLPDLARQCDVDIRTVRRWVTNAVPGLPIVRIGRRPYVHREDWGRWLAARRVARNPAVVK